MYLSAYHFDGDPAALTSAYDRMAAGFPRESFDLHVCVARDGGITLFDACPSLEIAEAFSGNEGFRGAVRAAGLPEPRVERLGDIHAAFARGGVVV